MELAKARTARDGPSERVLAAARSDDEDFHAAESIGGSLAPRRSQLVVATTIAPGLGGTPNIHASGEIRAAV
jgi:hypothetical protein